MNSKLKIAVIGCGGISNCHLGGYSRNPNVEIYALCDINKARAEEKAAKYNVPPERVFDDKDKDVHYDLNFAVLTSGMSFSCGNLFPSMLKDNGVPVMGETSGGGSCAIQAMCTADGFCFQISSFRARLNTLAGENIDEGITPDLPIATSAAQVEVSEEEAVPSRDFSKYFDVDYLTKLLSEYKK